MVCIASFCILIFALGFCSGKKRKNKVADLIKRDEIKDVTDLISGNDHHNVNLEMDNQEFREMESISNKTTSISKDPIIDFSSLRNPPPSYSDVMKNDSKPPDYSESFWL